MGLEQCSAGQQKDTWIATEAVIARPRHAFYDRLNKVLDSVRFDLRIEDVC